MLYSYVYKQTLADTHTHINNLCDTQSTGASCVSKMINYPCLVTIAFRIFLFSLLAFCTKHLIIILRSMFQI